MVTNDGASDPPDSNHAALIRQSPDKLFAVRGKDRRRRESTLVDGEATLKSREKSASTREVAAHRREGAADLREDAAHLREHAAQIREGEEIGRAHV